jgi:signal transduction histidine kinase
MILSKQKEKLISERNTVMQKYAGLVDKLVIFICCLAVYLCQTEMRIFSAVALISFIFACLLSYFDGYILKTCLTVGFIVLSFFFEEFLFFMPLTAYDMLFHKLQAVNLLALVPIADFIGGKDIVIPVTVCIMILLSILLRFRMETGRKREEKYRNLSDAAREMSMQLKRQKNELIEKQDNELSLATMNERNRIAREIHDNVGHLLSSAILQSGALKTLNRDERLNGNIQALHDTLSRAMNSIRDSVHRLYDESVDLNAKFTEIINKFTFCEISYENNINSNPDKKIKYAFISILQEALTNIINHSDATEVRVVLNEHPALYQLIIKDNGKVKKFDANDGLGIRNMIDRVHSLNGNINIITANGFEIFIAVPKEAHNDESAGSR